MSDSIHLDLHRYTREEYDSNAIAFGLNNVAIIDGPFLVQKTSDAIYLVHLTESIDDNSDDDRGEPLLENQIVNRGSHYSGSHYILMVDGVRYRAERSQMTDCVKSERYMTFGSYSDKHDGPTTLSI